MVIIILNNNYEPSEEEKDWLQEQQINLMFCRGTETFINFVSPFAKAEYDQVRRESIKSKMYLIKGGREDV